MNLLIKDVRISLNLKGSIELLKRVLNGPGDVLENLSAFYRGFAFVEASTKRDCSRLKVIILGFTGLNPTYYYYSFEKVLF